MDPSLTTLDNRWAVALTIYGEARGEPIEGKIGVGCVIRNRFRSGRGGARSFKEVCFAPAQFSCWNPDDPNAAFLLARAKSGITNQVLDECLWVAGGIISDAILERVGRSEHYHTRGVAPKWSVGKTPAFIIGKHLFFEGIV